MGGVTSNAFLKAAKIARGHSPFLAQLLDLHPQVLVDLEAHGADAVYADFCSGLANITIAETNKDSLMQALRLAKGRLALLTALCDIAGVWELEQVTAALSDFAEECLKITVNFLLHEAQKKGEITSQHNTLSTPLPSPPPQGGRECYGSGFIVLGMGKLGGRELNYSSDIDLILFYEPEKINYQGKNTKQHFMNKLAHELVSIMQDRTRDGYVFRTDLRLRPDPASTPPVVSVEAAYYYYEGVGQNWERAAMIKARPVAGDIKAGERFLKSLAPFMWRRSLDFAAIKDIHSIKRQMDSRQNPEIRLAGHNVKLGLGGIREIEFFVQIYQLIWGGRELGVRLRPTCEALAALHKMGLVDAGKEKILFAAYRYLRTVEHRIQMVADQQTHSLPDDDAGLANIAGFMGYGRVEDFSADLLGHLSAVHEIYANSFRSEAEQLGGDGNLVFTGVSHDEETLKTLRAMGYNQPEVVSEIVMGWHHGSSRATRTKRARELLTELMPALLKKFAETPNPDAAFLKFSEFLKNLPASVQLFSLFQLNPQLLALIADIMGSSKMLSDSLSHSPTLLDAVLYPDFYESLPSKQQLAEQLESKLKTIEFFEDALEYLRQFRNEKRFQAGVQLLKNLTSARAVAEFLSDLAELMVQSTLAVALADFKKTYGKIIDSSGVSSRFAIIALGKLGSREMTFSSDLDLVFIYDTPDFDALSDGQKSFTASVYYNRFAQRLLNALSGMGNSGRLYEVDTRLRPSGKQGMLAVSVKALTHYFDEMAWTFEYMALTKARPVAGDASLLGELEVFINHQLKKPRDAEKLRADVADMRERMDKEHGTNNIWDIKNVRGGLVDVDFIAQYLLLRHGSELENIKSGSAHDIFQMLKQAGCIDGALADELICENDFLGRVFNMLRLCHENSFSEETATQGLKKLLVNNTGEKDFNSLKAQIKSSEEKIHSIYCATIAKK